ncbi:uncharacterized protein LOC123536639 [Mercenaria mercenaria]|uniref:uncharacterized protein LOC123536639 n=1 Tax=Mercenaria mercenaria TaxID=6596 RepID=UPI00234F51E4|nr:uncharacterized protein LOC123536639 [Mercenaria mercenaria]
MILQSMISDLVLRFQKMGKYEKVSLVLLFPANVMYTIAASTHFWFELPGVAWYGLFYAKFCDLLDECHYVPAFFTNEPGFYHLLQLVCVSAWACLALSFYMLISDSMDSRIPRILRKNRNNTIAFLCFASAFAMSGGLYLFYYIINEFPREVDKYPEMKWASMFASLACGLEFLAGLLLLHAS